jgi:hypothetical protein
VLRRLGIAAGTAAVLLTVADTTAAWAASVDNMIPTSTYHPYCYDQTLDNIIGLCQTDNAAISVWMQSSVSTNMRSRIRDALDNSFDATAALSVSYASTPVYTGSAETDIIYQQGSIPYSGTVGITWCNDAVDNAALKCDQTYIRFTTDTYYEHRALTCHETGHAVGLTHGADASPVVSNSASVLGCMVTPYDVDAYTLGANNVQEIDYTY